MDRTSPNVRCVSMLLSQYTDPRPVAGLAPACAPPEIATEDAATLPSCAAAFDCGPGGPPLQPDIASYHTRMGCVELRKRRRGAIPACVSTLGSWAIHCFRT